MVVDLVEDMVVDLVEQVVDLVEGMPVDFEEDMLAWPVVSNLPPLFLVPFHIDASPAVLRSGRPHMVVVAAELSTEDSSLTSEAHPLQVEEVFGATFAGL